LNPFSLFRDDGRVFACDELSLNLAKEAVELSVDEELNVVERQFLYMPFMLS
jgi:uncharacterized protein (DUF924 family)